MSISAVDLAESTRFYVDVLGLEEIATPTFARPVQWLRIGSLQLHLFVDEHDAEAPPRHHLGLTVDDFDEAYRMVKQYVDDLTLALAELDVGSLTDVLQAILDALHTGRRVLIAGNGGSSTAAIHIAADLAAASGALTSSPQIVALTENIARVLAIANDYSFDVTKTVYADWTKVTLYRNGVLIWGTEPPAAPASAPTFVVASPTP